MTVGQSAGVEDHTFRRLIVGAWGGADQVRADEYAHSGDTTRRVDQKVPAGEQVDVAMVETGTNDLWKRNDPGQLEVDYGALLDKLRESSPQAALLCLGVWQRPSDALAYDLPMKDRCVAHCGRFPTLAGIYDLEGVRAPANLPLALKDGGVSDEVRGRAHGGRRDGTVPSGTLPTLHLVPDRAPPLPVPRTRSTSG